MIDWIPLLPETSVPHGASRCFLVRGHRIAVFHLADGKWHACDDLCPHALAPLSDGWIEGDALVCPWHGARFSLLDGKPEGPLALSCVRIYPLRVEKGILQVDWPQNLP